MRVRVQREQTLLVTTEHVIWRYANAFIFTNQSELDFGIALVYMICNASVTNKFKAWARVQIANVSQSCTVQGSTTKMSNYFIHY